MSRLLTTSVHHRGHWTVAAYGSLKPLPTERLRRAHLHLSYSMVLSHLLDTSSRRTVRERLRSYGSRHGATPPIHLPMRPQHRKGARSNASPCANVLTASCISDRPSGPKIDPVAASTDRAPTGKNARNIPRSRSEKRFGVFRWNASVSGSKSAKSPGMPSVPERSSLSRAAARPGNGRRAGLRGACGIRVTIAGARGGGSAAAWLASNQHQRL
jgi:hypothetical protein